MKKVLFILTVFGILLGCKTAQVRSNEIPKNGLSDTIRIANEKEEYEILIIDPGFTTFLYGQARPRGYYTLEFLEQRNQICVIEWNNRVRTPMRFNPNLYRMEINYDPNVRYGYEVNYLLYNYFVYFQLQYKQQLGGFVPRI